MHDVGDLAVHGDRSADDVRAEGLADGLMPEADAEERDGAVGANEVDDAAGARRSARSGRDDDGARPVGDQRVGIEGVVAHDTQALARDALDLLDQVVGEGVVVIDYGDGAKDTSRLEASTRLPRVGRSWFAQCSIPRCRNTSGSSPA